MEIISPEVTFSTVQVEKFSVGAPVNEMGDEEDSSRQQYQNGSNPIFCRFIIYSFSDICILSRTGKKERIIMGLLNLFKGKKRDTDKPVEDGTDSEKLSDPGQPTADTLDLVSVIAIDDPFLITKEGAFVLMFEIPKIDMDIYGMTEREICERYQAALGALPPSTKFQMTVFEDHFDPSDDIRYFTERSEKFESEIAYEDPISEFYIQGQSLSASSIAMAARTAEIYDRVKPDRFTGKVKAFEECPH